VITIGKLSEKSKFIFLVPKGFESISYSKRHDLSHFRDAVVFGTFREKILGMSNKSSFKIKRSWFRRFCQKLFETPENAVEKFSEF